ncbi:MAG TPA: acyl-CoA desaturase [Microthrixaceae bacterium]|nr:acyl-CoA desaturase [Microthrixaceae bacterium]
MTASTTATPIRTDKGNTAWLGTVPFWLVHVLPFLAFLTGVPWWNWVLMAGLFFVRMFFITAGYHRYFSHRSFSTSRWFQFVLAFGGATSAQKGPLWWAGNHRLHHRYVDTARDAHTPIKGVWWSHVGWILSDAHDATPNEAIEDFTKYPELRWLDRTNWLPPWVLAVTVWLVAGWSGLLIGFFLSTVLLWHATFMVNSVAHLIGTRRYATDDTSRNNFGVAVLTMGEGWHNNHHYYPASARQGFFWFEPDITYTILKGLSWLGIVRDLKQPSHDVKRGMRIKDGNIDIGMLHANLRNVDEIVDRSRVPTLDVNHSDTDNAKTRLELALTEVSEAASDLRRIDRRRRREAATRTRAEKAAAEAPEVAKAAEVVEPAE